MSGDRCNIVFLHGLLQGNEVAPRHIVLLTLLYWKFHEQYLLRSVFWKIV